MAYNIEKPKSMISEKISRNNFEFNRSNAYENTKNGWKPYGLSDKRTNYGNLVQDSVDDIDKYQSLVEEKFDKDIPKMIDELNFVLGDIDRRLIELESKNKSLYNSNSNKKGGV